ncbi:hypothetical protein L2E82_31051 [Cichorium intybus]|uniref:Uncharacterized protein n=1 Tax=Cichorium intybus TaxID=13427 RepID=A0ACB9D2F9_CICIN|nr:hypothetical protein L2E82_31051 [Cichorium intybus]
MDTIIKKIEEAYIQNEEATSTITLRSYSYQNLESFLIPFKAINLGTRIGKDGNGSSRALRKQCIFKTTE